MNIARLAFSLEGVTGIEIICCPGCEGPRAILDTLQESVWAIELLDAAIRYHGRPGTHQPKEHRGNAR